MATLSMTGFGEGSAEGGGVEIVVELKTVNHRFLDVVCKLPGSYARFETGLVKVIREALRRGRIDLFVSRTDTGDTAYDLEFNRTLFENYLEVIRVALKGAPVREREVLGPMVANVLNKREVLELVSRETDAGEEYELVERALKQALERLIEMRSREGAELEAEVLSHLDRLEQILEQITGKAEATPEDFKRRLSQRLDRIAGGVEVEPERLAQEVALMAERCDVTEELARLQSHVMQFRKTLEDGEGGRKLEFLLQEMVREINTTGSKAQDSEVTALVVEAKSIVEKLREQVQNIE